MSALQYRIDGNPASRNDLITMAEGYDDGFTQNWLKVTSQAARILRINGHTVDENPDFVENDRKETQP